MSQEIARIVNTLMTRCELPLSSTPVDEGFLQLCLEDAAARGCPMEASPGIPSFHPWSTIGGTMACITYGHLESISAKLHTALCTSLGLYIEDVYADQPDLVYAFGNNFAMHLPQPTAAMQAFDQLLRETPNHFDTVQANLIVPSMLNFVASIAIEQGIGKLEINPDADNFPVFLRGLSGVACAYCMFIFPRGVHINSYIQAMPSIMDFIHYMNDVLSFYKEELDGEDNNYISIVSKNHGVPKAEVLEQLAHQVRSSYVTANNILRASGAAQVAWERFARGYVGFHASCARYRLHEVMDIYEGPAS